MKTYKNLYPKICEFENLYLSWRAARRGKRDRQAVADFEFNLEHSLLELQEELRNHTYLPGIYHNFYIREPKKRLGVSPDVLLEESQVAPAKPWSKPPFSMLNYSRYFRRFT